MSTGLQARCLASSALAHGLLVGVLLLAPGFRPQHADMLGAGPPLEMMSGGEIDAALAPGPAPLAHLESTPATELREPQVRQPEVRQPKPLTPPVPKPPQVPPPDHPEKADKPERPVPRTPSEIKFDLPKSEGTGFELPSSRSSTKDPKKKNPDSRFDFSKARTVKLADVSRKPDPEAAEREAAAAAAAENRARLHNLARSLDSATGNLERSGGKGTLQVRISSGTEGGTGGGGGGGGAGKGGGGGSAYGWQIRNAFDNAWVAPTGIADDLATTDVEVVIRKDGKILSSRIVKRSGIAALDRSVQDAINRIGQVPAFETGATDDQRSYTIGFNMRGKRTF